MEPAWNNVDDVLESLDTEELTSVEASKGIKLLKDQDAHEHDHEHNSENDPPCLVRSTECKSMR